MPLAAAARQHKYHAEKAIADGVMFDSKRERMRAWELEQARQMGQIEWWSYGPRYLLQEGTRDATGKRVAPITYRPDFLVRERGVLRAEDTKGVQTAEFRLKARLWAGRYPDIELRVVT